MLSVWGLCMCHRPCLFKQPWSPKTNQKWNWKLSHQTTIVIYTDMRDYTERTLDELSQSMVLLCNTYNSVTQLYPNLYVSTRHHVTMIPHYADDSLYSYAKNCWIDWVMQRVFIWRWKSFFYWKHHKQQYQKIWTSKKNSWWKTS